MTMSAIPARLKSTATRTLAWLVQRSQFVEALMAVGTRVAVSVSNRVTRSIEARSLGLFDRTFYLSQLPSSPWSVRDPLGHYLLAGADEGFDPHPLFDSKYYVDRNPDVTRTGLNPLVHYLLLGGSRGLKTHPVFEDSPVVVGGLLDRHPNYRRFFYDRYALPGKWYDGETPEVSIVILAYHNSRLTAHCLDSVWRHTEGATYEVIVLDNGSSFRDIAAVTSYLFAGRLVALLVNRGFGEGNNIAAELAKGTYLFFLNNDASVTANWLEPLIDVMRQNPDAGAVGSRLHYPNGVLQEAGAMVLENGDTVQIGKGDTASRSGFNVVEPVDYCSASALLVKKNLFVKCLGFDYRFDPAYYEDADLCFKLRELGTRVFFCPDSVVLHNESSSASDPRATERLENVVETNKAKFLQKWQPLLSRATIGSLRPTPPGPARNGMPVAGVRRFGANRGGPRIGLFCPFVLVPGGGERYLFSIAEMMSELGCDVDLVTPHKYSELRVASVTGELGVDITSLRLRTVSEMDREQRYDLFVSIGNEIFPPIAGHGARNFYVCQFPFPMSDISSEKRSWYEDYDAVLVYSEFCATNLASAARRMGLEPPSTRVVHPPVAMVGNAADARRRMILTVGRFFVGGHNKKQLEMVRNFRRMCDEGLSGWELHLAGGVHPSFEHREYFLSVRREAVGYPIMVHANPSRLDLEHLYRNASIYWHAAGLDEKLSKHPERFEHFGITTVEAMSAGVVPVVLGQGGQGEIVEDGTSGFLWHRAEELVARTKATIDLHERGALGAFRREAVRRASNFDVRRFRDRMAVALALSDLRERV